MEDSIFRYPSIPKFLAFGEALKEKTTAPSAIINYLPLALK
jgi:hypothetical protein